MKELIIELCNEVLGNNGINPPQFRCGDIDCEECPFGKLNDNCQDLTRFQNIRIATEYLDKINKTTPGDKVNHPNHYNTGTIEVITVIEDWKLNFNLGNSIKYIARCEHKENKKQDLEKAKWYIEREIRKCK